LEQESIHLPDASVITISKALGDDEPVESLDSSSFSRSPPLKCDEQLSSWNTDARPFNPLAAAAEDSAPATEENKVADVEEIEEDPEYTAKMKIVQTELDRVIRIMKAQHQYINNLQQANLQLKSKVKTLEELKQTQEFATEAITRDAPPQPVYTPTQNDLEDEGQDFEMLELVPIGSIEQENKRAWQERQDQFRD